MKHRVAAINTRCVLSIDFRVAVILWPKITTQNGPPQKTIALIIAAKKTHLIMAVARVSCVPRAEDFVLSLKTWIYFNGLRLLAATGAPGSQRGDAHTVVVLVDCHGGLVTCPFCGLP